MKSVDLQESETLGVSAMVPGILLDTTESLPSITHLCEESSPASRLILAVLEALPLESSMAASPCLFGRRGDCFRRQVGPL